MRVNVYVPETLGERVRAELPDVNISAVLQEALRRLLDCGHERLVCADCGHDVPASEVAGVALLDFYRRLLWAWEPLVDRHGTAVGAAQVAKGVALELDVPGVDAMPLPRPARAA